MGGVGEQGYVAGKGVGKGYFRQVSPDVPVAVAGQARVAEGPVQKARAVESEGPESAGGGTALGPDLYKLAPAGIPADDVGLAAPKVVDLAHQGEGGRHGCPALRVQVVGQGVQQLPARADNAARSASSSSRAEFW